MLCPNCGQENEEGGKFCVKCGKPVDGTEGEVVRCPSCGKDNTKEALFCADCGKSMGAPEGKVGFANPPQAPGCVPPIKPFSSNIALDIILSIITCGIYWFFWQARQMRALNHMLGEQRFNFVLWFFVSLITCYIFNIYYEYIMAQAIIEIQRREGRSPSNDLPVLCLVLSIFGLHIITDAIQQNEINKLCGQ